MATSFTVEIDWEHDLSWTDETSRTRRVQIRAGFEQPGDLVAAVGRCTLTLDNEDGRFSPGNSASPLYGDLLPRRAVRVSAVSGGSTWVLFRGFVESIQPAAGVWGSGECVVECVDALAVLARQRIGVTYAASKAVDDAVDAVVSEAYTPPDTAYSDNGDTVAHYGRSWKPEETTCLDALREIAEAVYGRFFVARDGTATFLSRNDLQDSSVAAAATFGDLAYWQRLMLVQPEHLVAYWRLSESEGSTANDSSDNELDGTVSGLTWGADGIGDGSRAASFDGVNDYVNVYSAGLASAFNGAAGTVMTWFRVSSMDVWNDGNNHYIARFTADGNNQVLVRKYANVQTRLYLIYLAGGTSKYVNYVVPSPDTEWHNLAVTWDASADEVKIYLDGEQVGTTQTGLGTWAGSLATAELGRFGATSFWDGDLAHVAVWDVALSGEEIADLAEV